MNNSEKGRYYEDLACDYLKRQGLHILERNYRFKRAEIDIIAAQQNRLVFIEVKFRSSTRKQYPIEAVDHKKIEQIRFAAMSYLTTRRYGADTPCRFDVISFIGDDMTHYQNAFGGLS